jgi:hypothetical protein
VRGVHTLALGLHRKIFAGYRLGGPLLACGPGMHEKWPPAEHNFGVTTALAIGLALSAWLALPFPLAVLVGRSMRAGAESVAPI